MGLYYRNMNNLKRIEDAFIEGRVEQENLEREREFLGNYPKTGVVCSLCKAPWLNGIKDQLTKEELEDWICPNCQADMAKEPDSVDLETEARRTLEDMSIPPSKRN